MPSATFRRLISAADVVLDTVHFNGMNTSLEAFSAGAAVVTLPTMLQRGRHTQAMYRKMGLADAIASDERNYVDIAVRLANDRDMLSELRRRITERNEALFEDARVTQEFAEAFENLLQLRFNGSLVAQPGDAGARA
jgi:predicted O-linked N-acetylglucosamine transferase (SPINDLY family)